MNVSDAIRLIFAGGNPIVPFVATLAVGIVLGVFASILVYYIRQKD